MVRKLILLCATLPCLVNAQKLDSQHILIDAECSNPQPFTYTTFQDASAHFIDNMTIYVKPGVYWIDNPDDPTVRIGQDGREPFGMVVKCKRLRIVGLGKQSQDVVLASQRGQTQGAVGNFTMFDFWIKHLTVENITMGNYCNVDLEYPNNPRWNRQKRSDAITQAHVGYVHGDTLIAKKVRFVSRLNLNPLTGAEYSYYEDCHFECTDDALNGNATYRHCDFDFYGSKPFWSTKGRGVLMIDCDFYAKNNIKETFFCKQGGPITLVNCRYHATSDDLYIGWTAYPQPWLRCYQKDFTLNGHPYTIGNKQPQNTLMPDFLTPKIQEAPFVAITKHNATLVTGQDSLRLTVSETPVTWRVDPGFESFVSISVLNGSACMVTPTNNTAETASFCISAVTANGCEAACYLTVKPSLLPPPVYVRKPQISHEGTLLTLDYELQLDGCKDESDITWSRDDIPVSVSNDGPQLTYMLSKADQGHTLSVKVRPKSSRSEYGNSFIAGFSVDNVGSKSALPISELNTDFHDFPCQWQPDKLAGFWTVDGFKPQDTSDYPWDFDKNKPMWEYKEGFNGAVGKGLLQAQRGARLMYTPLPYEYGDMHLLLVVDPTKTAGQGFGSATGQYMDVCLKFDTESLTGYGLRIIRTTKHAKAVDFLLVRYNNGIVTPLSKPITATCYLTDCSISLDFIGGVLSAHVETSTPQPEDSELPHTVDLVAEVDSNTFGGIHIQHTGSSGGESTTMLHRLDVKWQ